jgi:hypothetical protein
VVPQPLASPVERRSRRREQAPNGPLAGCDALGQHNDPLGRDLVEPDGRLHPRRWLTGNAATDRSRPSCVVRRPAVGAGSETIAASRRSSRTAAISSRPNPGSRIDSRPFIDTARRYNALGTLAGRDAGVYPIRKRAAARSRTSRVASRALSTCCSTRRASESRAAPPPSAKRPAWSGSAASRPAPPRACEPAR